MRGVSSVRCGCLLVEYSWALCVGWRLIRWSHEVGVNREVAMFHLSGFPPLWLRGESRNICCREGDQHLRVGVVDYHMLSCVCLHGCRCCCCCRRWCKLFSVVLLLLLLLSTMSVVFPLAVEL